MLEVHKQLEQPIHEIQDDDDELDDTEKAIVREMCNVSTTIALYSYLSKFLTMWSEWAIIH